ncbi:ATP-binding protein [Legionella lytica]|uniref:ATP-binding protein n=1 Tax=Legionella lytica TaxID=96232 RepID=A0ABW8D6S7_9GAMM
MICLELISLEQVKSDKQLWKTQMQDYEHQVQCYFEEKIGASRLTAAHRVALESLNELIKNAIDAGAHKLFLEDISNTLASICIFDDGDGFSTDFLGPDSVSVNYAKKLSGCNSLISHKIGQNKLGGQGRGLAQAYEVIKQFDGQIICSHRQDKMKGASITFNSSNTPVSTEDIFDLFNAARSSWSSHYCQYDQEQGEAIVSQMKDSFRLFVRKSSRESSQSLNTSNDPLGLAEIELKPLYAPH